MSSCRATNAKTNNKPSEQDSKEAMVRLHLAPFFGATLISAIGAEAIEKFKAARLAAGAAPKTVNNELTALRTILRVACEWGRIASIPKVRWLKVPKPPFDFLDFEEAARLVHAADGDEWRTMILVGLRAGLRQSELLELRWSDVDLVAGRLLVRRAIVRGKIGTPKNHRERELPLSAEASTALRRLPSRFRGDLVWPGEGEANLTKGEAKWPLWRACKRAGLRRIGWHVLRHTFASHLVMKGVPLKAVQELMGHATIEMTMRYAHLSPDVRRDAVHLLDGAAVASSTRAGTG
jgi:integrase